ncbi:MAG TPA: hypothetical protein IAC81_01040 [Candidatus Scatomorpha stercorigallinarum]|nr:hypothetical protein [Candidatus Scatomorpha stercorigallinarum]
MRNNALTICCGVCVAGAFGVFTRWMQDLTAFDEHGLYVRGNIWGAVLLLLCIAAAGAMLGAIWYLKNHERLVSPAGFGAAHAGGGVIRRAAWLIIAVFMAVACFALLLTAGSSQYASLLRVLALLGLLADAGFAGMAAAGGRGEKESSGASPLVCLACVLPVAFCCFWLVVSYRQDAATAVVWRYGPEISAIACSLLAFYYLAGHAFGRPRAYTAMFFCACGAFLCFTALPGSRLMALQLLLAGSALMQLFFLASLAANLRRAPEAVPREAEEEPDAPPAQPPEEFGTLDDALRAEREDEEFAGSFVEYDPGEPRQKNR